MNFDMFFSILGKSGFFFGCPFERERTDVLLRTEAAVVFGAFASLRACTENVIRKIYDYDFEIFMPPLFIPP